MSEQQETHLDKGCILAITACTIFFVVPIAAWWIPVVWKCLQWLFRWAGFDV
jgi:hypothetical protein